MPPAAAIAHHPFVKSLTHALRHRCEVPEHARILVAVSGGADSVALLRALAAIASRRTWHLHLTVGHVQHHLRDDNGHAERDAGFVKQLAESLHLPYVRADLNPDTAKGNTEAWARRARYDALRKLAGDRDATHVAVAHHGDDQLETVLMRLLRGSSITGLAAMAWRRPLRSAKSEITLIRPMLAVDRAGVLQFLADQNQPWCEDHTNADVSRQRARLRQDVLPVLHAMRPDVSHKAVALADHLRDVNAYIHLAADRAYEELVTHGEHQCELPRAAARKLPKVVLTRVLQRMLDSLHIPADRMTRKALQPIVRVIRDQDGDTRYFNLPQGHSATITAVSISFSGE